MFKWLSNRGEASPAEQARAALAGMTGTPAAVLQQVCDWVDEHARGGGAAPELLRLADERLEPVLAELATGLERQRRTTGSPRLLRGYCERFARAYALAFAALPAGDAAGARLALRAAQLFGRASRLARKSYEDPGALRGEMMTFLAQAHQRGVLLQKTALAAGQPETSVAQEFGIAFLWDTAPFDALTLEQIEYFDRFVGFFGSRIILKATPGATAPYAVLPDGRVAAPGQADPTQATLFVGPGPLAGLAAGVLKLPDTDPLPEWANPPLPHTNLQTLKGLAQRLVATWERKRIKRGSERVARNDAVRVSGGFENIRRAVAYSAYVRSGGKLKAYITHSQLVNERSREVMVGVDDDGRTHTPIEILAAMEATGDKQAIESWQATDSSATGYSMVVPGFRAWLGVGGLLAVREADRIDWQIGIVRRLYSAGGGRRVGIEMIQGVALPAGIASGQEPDQVGLADLRDAIVVKAATGTWLITAFPCVVDGHYVLASYEGRQRIKVCARHIDHPEYSVNAIEAVAAGAA